MQGGVRRKPKNRLMAIGLGLIYSTSPAYALTGTVPFNLTLDVQKQSRVLHAPSKRKKELSLTRNHPFALLQQQRLDLRQSVQSFLRQSGLNLELKTRPRAKGLQFHNASPDVLDFEFSGFRICDHSVKSQMTRDGEVYVAGKIPEIKTTNTFSVEDFGLPYDALQTLHQALADQNIATHDLTTLSLDKCLFVHRSGYLVPVWDITVEAEGLPYRGLASTREVLHFENRFFGAIGMTKVYKQNPRDGELGFITVGDLVGDGTLSSSAFEINPGISFSRANSCTHEFVYEPEEFQFAEVSAFTHATTMLAWYNEQFDYKWDKDTPRMEIRIRELIHDDPNNALYVPPTTSRPHAQIRIGEGDGVTLQNLIYDADVVSHEFGHHIVYNTVTSIEGESLVLHEGLADFFTFARTGDPCLGESICPDGSAICEVEGKCLRTAKTDFKLTSPHLPTTAHLRSQFISGFLWDMYENDDFAAADLTNIVYRSLTYLSESTSYEEFLNALVQADKDLFGGAHCSLIHEAAIERGMESFVDEMKKCSKPKKTSLLLDESLPTQEETSSQYILAINDSREANTFELTDNCAALSSSKQRKQSASWYKCGQVSQAQEQPFSWVTMVFILLLPFVIVGYKRRFSS